VCDTSVFLSGINSANLADTTAKWRVTVVPFGLHVCIRNSRYLISRYFSLSPLIFRETKGAPKKSPSAFLYFSQVMRPKLQIEHTGVKNTEISKMLGKLWKSISHECKEVYQDRERSSRAHYKAQTKAWTDKKGGPTDDDMLPLHMGGHNQHMQQDGGQEYGVPVSQAINNGGRSNLLPQGSCKDTWRSFEQQLGRHKEVHPPSVDASWYELTAEPQPCGPKRNELLVNIETEVWSLLGQVRCYVHTFICAYVRTLMHSYTHTCMHSSIHTCIRLYTHPFIRAYTYPLGAGHYEHDPAQRLPQQVRRDSR
jgi:hypothetical protein